MVSESIEKKWRIKKSLLIFFLALLPAFNFSSFLYMAGEAKSKRLSIMGWSVLFLTVVLFTAIGCNSCLINPYEAEYNKYCAETQPEIPAISDYLGSNYSKAEYPNGKTYKFQPEYEEYLAANDKYKDWMNLSETIDIKEKFDNRERIRSAVEIGLIATMFFKYFVVAADAVFIERPKHLRALSPSRNEGIVKSRLEGSKSVPNNIGVSAVLPAETQTTVGAVTITPAVQPVQNDANYDLNQMTETDISVLPGLTIIDAKKAIEYRTQKGGFYSVDEFFNCIGAKPHIVARLTPVLSVSPIISAQSSALTAGNGGVRRKIDL